MSRCFVFPGQGSQAVGMGRDLAEAFPAARLVFDEVDDALGQHLSRLMWDGSESDLTLTENAQPALMAVSLAVIRVLEGESGRRLPAFARCVAGHSLGEYSALAAAGTFSLADAARLLRRRGQAMQSAVPVGAGAMAAVLGLDLEAVRALAADAAAGEVLDAANDNGGGQVVISGTAAAVERAVKLGPARGAKRVIPLTVSAPFHCRLMQPAADVMAEALAGVTMQIPSVPVIANVTAEPVNDPDRIRALLVAQVTGLVRWRECIEALAGLDVHQVVEAGAGKVLSGLARRINKDLGVASVGTPADVDAILKQLS